MSWGQNMWGVAHWGWEAHQREIEWGDGRWGATTWGGTADEEVTPPSCDPHRRRVCNLDNELDLAGGIDMAGDMRTVGERTDADSPCEDS